MGLDIIARIAPKLQFANRVTAQATQEVDFQSRKMAKDFVDRIAVHPPETAGNRPPPPYWQRKVGRRLVGGGINPKSLNYTESWKIAGISTPFGGKVTTTTNVTYAPFLIDPNKQASWHQVNGWKTITMVADELGIKVDTTGAGVYAVSEGGGYIQLTKNKIENFMRSLLS